MNRVIQYIILICFFNGLIHSEPIRNNNSLHPIDVEVHNGIESLLIHWSYPDSIEVKSINIYKRSNQQNEFMLITQIINETDRSEIVKSIIYVDDIIFPAPLILNFSAPPPTI